MNINNKNLCPDCFTETSEAVCPVCDYREGRQAPFPAALPLGTILLGRYIIGRTLGKGGFGITYLAYDSVEDKKVAVKEFMPDNLTHRNNGEASISTFHGDKDEAFKKGAEKFYEEAQMVSRFNGNPGLIWVYKFFYENNTAYYVMEYLEGVDLKVYISKNNGVLSERQVVDITASLIDSLIIVHSIDILHRDISPDNVYITDDGKIKLLDFGAARQVLGEASQSLSIILKQGFAPIEQYQTKGNQGQWTDIYALGATMYYCLTGKTPDAPMDRLEEDNLIMPENISDGLKAVMRKMLAVRATNRYQSVMELKQDLKAYGLIGGTIVPQVSQTHLPSPESAPVLKKKSFALPAALISACFVIIISVVIFIVAGGSADDDFIPADAGNIPRVTDAPLPAVTTEPPVTTTTPPPMPEPQYVRTVTLGQFEWNNEDAPETQQGWISDGYAGLRTSLTIQNFKQSRYLIIEFETVPLGNVNLYWNSELNPWSRYEIPGLQTRYIIDMTLIPNYNLYLESDEIRLLLGYYNSTWADLRLKDAYFANLD